MRNAIAAISLMLLVGCVYPNQFRNVSAGDPHAVLLGEEVAVIYINGQPTSFWRCREQYRIPPGKTALQVTSNTWVVPDYPPVVFEAIADYCYTLTYERSDGIHRIFVWEWCPEGGSERVITEVNTEHVL